MTVGGRNLAILGVVSAVIALATTGASLVIYHNSGDIYLDRSRPGYLPDKEEIEQDDAPGGDYELGKNGEINAEVLGEYLKELTEEIEAVDTFATPFDEKVLSDEKLMITPSRN